MIKTGLAVMTDGCRISWQLAGPVDAPVLMLSNSLGTTMDMWQSQQDSFHQQFRLLRYDTRGHGGSDSTPGGYSLDRLGRDALELIDALNIDRIHFCGLSLGGMTGQWLGVFAPDRLERLVLANTAAYMGPPAGWQTRIDAVLQKGMAEIADPVLERWFTPNFRASLPEVVGDFKQQLLTTDSRGYAGCCAAIRDMDLRPIINQISCPTLVIAGTLDPATTPLQTSAIASAINGAEFMQLEAAHLSNIEQPEQFTNSVLDFLS